MAFGFASLAATSLAALYYFRYLPTISSHQLSSNPATLQAFTTLNRYFTQNSILSTAHSPSPSCGMLLGKTLIPGPLSATLIATNHGHLATPNCQSLLETLSQFITEQLGPRPPAHNIVVPLTFMAITACIGLIFQALANSKKPIEFNNEIPDIGRRTNPR